MVLRGPVVLLVLGFLVLGFLVLGSALTVGALAANAAERHIREVPQVSCSKGQYRFDPRLYRCLEVIVYERRNGRRVPRLYHVWEKRRGRR